jgi:hypothetical protein
MRIAEGSQPQFMHLSSVPISYSPRAAQRQLSPPFHLFLVARILAITASRDLGKNLACCCRQDGARRQTSTASRIHRAKHYRSAIAGIAPMMFVSDHHFPRHSHDQFGVGVIVSGGQRSWSDQALPSEVTYDPLL